MCWHGARFLASQRFDKPARRKPAGVYVRKGMQLRFQVGVCARYKPARAHAVEAGRTFGLVGKDAEDVVREAREKAARERESALLHWGEGADNGYGEGGDGSFEFGGVNDGLEKEEEDGEEDEGRFERFSLSSALENLLDAQLNKRVAEEVARRYYETISSIRGIRSMWFEALSAHTSPRRSCFTLAPCSVPAGPTPYGIQYDFSGVGEEYGSSAPPNLQVTLPAALRCRFFLLAWCWRLNPRVRLKEHHERSKLRVELTFQQQSFLDLCLISDRCGPLYISLTFFISLTRLASRCPRKRSISKIAES
ncbi:hypothetical protein B0H13DRAFT_2518353 [Mycena leptocephala]|nr:hypothetical protein B0H13DRAFT_2380021 [Mycena leptocephala]KAJ7852869.1 hypothetical protein B0H13DRAFT_2581519 [Mycena leptocephala]KAJ7899808.1 hypothetical protein B0H13DRAFT_2518353 [Mycena leptocephala]